MTPFKTIKPPKSSTRDAVTDMLAAVQRMDEVAFRIKINGACSPTNISNNFKVSEPSEFPTRATSYSFPSFK